MLITSSLIIINIYLFYATMIICTKNYIRYGPSAFELPTLVREASFNMEARWLKVISNGLLASIGWDDQQMYYDCVPHSV